MIKKQFFRFIVIGMLSTIVNYACFYAFLTLLSVNYIIASAAGFILGVFAGYFFNKSWTFEVTEKSKANVVKYYFVYIASLILSLAFLKVTVGHMGISAKIANIIAIGITTCTNFIGIKFWVFKK
jgi:putative flippase GtrA